MPLPNASSAVIDRAKLQKYLLSLEHPVGRFKARFFATLGFSAERWAEFETAIREQHLRQDAQVVETGQYGQAYQIRGILTGPNGKSAVVISAWFVRAGESSPRFVTAYPGESK